MTSPFGRRPFGRLRDPQAWPVRVKLSLMVMLGMLAMALAISVLMFATATSLFVKQAHAELERQNHAVASEIENLTDRAAASLLIARQNPAFNRLYEADPADEAGRRAALKDVQDIIVYLQRAFAIDEICLIDFTNTEDARSVPGELAPPDDLSHEEAHNPFFAPTMALAEGEVYRSTEPYLSPDTDRFVVAHATPITLANGTRAGLLHFEIPLDWFADKIRDTQLTGGYSFLMDREGHLLVHPDLALPAHPDDEHGFPHASSWGSESFRATVADMLRDGSGTTHYDTGGETYEVVHQRVFADQWIVATVMPHAMIYGPGGQLLRETVVIVLPLLALALALMIWYGSRLLGPLRSLAAALHAVGAGNVQTLGIQGEDEIGELGRAFDYMAGELDVSLRKRVEMEAALQHQALHDALTSLPNRAWLADRLEEAIASGKRDHRTWALLMLDLDRFKEVNDTLGHQIGDELLQEVARRLQAELRTCDAVARLGGDEFAVLLGETDEVTAPLVVSRLIEVLEAPIQLAGQEVAIGASAGIALYPQHGEDVTTLVRRADMAMYVAKRSGSGYAVSTPEHEQPATERLARIGALRNAIATDQLVLYYQPIVDCATQKVTGAEALVRWHHPQHGLIPPDQFIPLAEETGLIRQLTRWVVRTAVSDCAAWQRAGLALGVAVNLSAHDVQDPELPSVISARLADADLDAGWLTLELTETALMGDPEQALLVLGRMKEMGIRIAIDDFGTGYSSLSYLTRLPANQLKVDRSFVSGLATGDREAAVVRSTIELAHTLGLTVVAEGVEDEATMELLVRAGADNAQGFLIGRPTPRRELMRTFGRRADRAA